MAGNKPRLHIKPARRPADDPATPEAIVNWTRLKDKSMTEFEEITTRIKASISRIPDRLTDKGTAIRAEYSGIFSQCIGGHEADPDFYSALPFQVSLHTDPHIYIVGGGLLVLDHPTKPRQFLSAIDSKDAHVVDLNKRSSLYEDRQPRLVACHRKGGRIEVGLMFNRLIQCEFRGPFAKQKKDVA